MRRVDRYGSEPDTCQLNWRGYGKNSVRKPPKNETDLI